MGKAEESVFLINISDDLDTIRTWAQEGILVETGPHCLHHLNHIAYVMGYSLTGYPRFSTYRAQELIQLGDVLLAETTVFIQTQ